MSYSTKTKFPWIGDLSKQAWFEFRRAMEAHQKRGNKRHALDCMSQSTQEQLWNLLDARYPDFNLKVVRHKKSDRSKQSKKSLKKASRKLIKTLEEAEGLARSTSKARELDLDDEPPAYQQLSQDHADIWQGRLRNRAIEKLKTHVATPTPHQAGHSKTRTASPALHALVESQDEDSEEALEEFQQINQEEGDIRPDSASGRVPVENRRRRARLFFDPTHMTQRVDKEIGHYLKSRKADSDDSCTSSEEDSSSDEETGVYRGESSKQSPLDRTVQLVEDAKAQIRRNPSRKPTIRVTEEEWMCFVDSLFAPSTEDMLYKELEDLKIQRAESNLLDDVLVYCKKFKTLVKTAKTGGVSSEQRIVYRIFVQGLKPASFKRSILDITDKDTPLDVLIRLTTAQILKYEMRMKDFISSQQDLSSEMGIFYKPKDSDGIQSHKKPSAKPFNSYNGQQHGSKPAFSTGYQGRSSASSNPVIKCNYCGILGHKEEACRKKQYDKSTNANKGNGSAHKQVSSKAAESNQKGFRGGNSKPNYAANRALRSTERQPFSLEAQMQQPSRKYKWEMVLQPPHDNSNPDSNDRACMAKTFIKKETKNKKAKSEPRLPFTDITFMLPTGEFFKKEAMIDSGSNQNYINPKLANELIRKGVAHSTEGSAVTGMNGNEFIDEGGIITDLIYNQNSDSEMELPQVEFRICDNKELEVILGFSLTNKLQCLSYDFSKVRFASIRDQAEEISSKSAITTLTKVNKPLWSQTRWPNVIFKPYKLSKAFIELPLDFKPPTYQGGNEDFIEEFREDNLAVMRDMQLAEENEIIYSAHDFIKDRYGGDWGCVAQPSRAKGAKNLRSQKTTSPEEGELHEASPKQGEQEEATDHQDTMAQDSTSANTEANKLGDTSGQNTTSDFQVSIAHRSERSKTPKFVELAYRSKCCNELVTGWFPEEHQADDTCGACVMEEINKKRYSATERMKRRHKAQLEDKRSMEEQMLDCAKSEGFAYFRREDSVDSAAQKRSWADVEELEELSDGECRVRPNSKQVTDVLLDLWKKQDKIYCLKLMDTPPVEVSRQQIADKLNTTRGANNWAFKPKKRQRDEVLFDKDTLKARAFRRGDIHDVSEFSTPEEKMAFFHNGRVGHASMHDIFEGIKRKGWHFPNITQQIADFIKNCPVCRQVKDGKLSHYAARDSVLTTEPFHSVAIISLGPFEVDEYGNQFIMAAVDCFTRYVELKPTRTTTAKDAADFVLEVSGRYGAPKLIITAEGKEFTEAIISNLMDILGPMEDCIEAYDHDTEGIVDRANEEICRHLRELVVKKNFKSTWSLLLPIVQRILNSSYHSAIGMEPYKLLFGHNLSLDRGLINKHKVKPRETIGDYLVNLAEDQAHLIEGSIKFQRTCIEKRVFKDPEGSSNNPVVYRVDDHILYKSPYSAEGNLTAKWRGPCIILEATPGSQKVTAQDYLNKSILTLPVDSIKKCNFAALDFPTTGRDSKKGPTSMWPVKEIVAHRHNPRATNKRNRFKFLVRWDGYTAEQDEWLNKKDVKHLTVYNDYIAKHPELHL